MMMRKHADGDEHVVDKGSDRAHGKLPLEAEPDIDEHGEQRGDEVHAPRALNLAKTSREP